MSVSKDAKRNTYYVQCRYRDWTGNTKKKTKRGFHTRKEAVAWEAKFLAQVSGTPDMTFGAFYELYREDTAPKLRENTWVTKEAIIEGKILPFFKDKPVNEIAPLDILNWQNEMKNERTSNGLLFSDTYLRTIENQLAAMLNHAVRYYNLGTNPMAKVERMGSKSAGEMRYWTKDEYLRFSRAMMDKPQSFIAFELLYWLGIRLGELLALTPSDFDFKAGRVPITKSYQRIKRRDVITAPKTEKSVRTIVVPGFLLDEVKDYLLTVPHIGGHDRMFSVTKAYLHHEMDRGCRETGVKRIRIHDLRHSHVSLLIDMGFSALAIAERLGHESTEVTMMYAHLFPNRQQEMADELEIQRGPIGGHGLENLKPMREVV